MSPFIIFLLIVSLALTLIGSLMLLVAAFRQGILWGLAYLFVPFAALVFLIIHWREAKAGFFVSLGGFACLVTALFSASEARETVARAAHVPWLAPAKVNIEDSSAAIQAQRDHLYDLQEELSRSRAEANSQYKALMDRRKGLKPGDHAGVHQFNLDAAAYKQQNEALQRITGEIAACNAELSRLLSERATQAAANSKKVVIYTTAWCPACKAAKQYMDSKGIHYQEVDVEQAPGGEAFQRLGGTAVPLIVVGDKKMTGFNPAALDAML
jgi:glutaredoxin